MCAMRYLLVALYVATVYVACASLKRKCESASPPTARQRELWNLAGVFSMPLVQGDSSNRNGS